MLLLMQIHLLQAKFLLLQLLSLKKLRGKKFDIVCCGKESTDFACGQITQELSEKLGYGEVVDVIGFEPKDGVLSVKKETEERLQHA